MGIGISVDVRSIPGETVLTLHGEFDISTQQVFASALVGVDENVARIVLEFSDLTFIDCANSDLIHQALILAGLRGAHFELRDPSARLQRIFDLTGLSDSNGDAVSPIVVSVPDPSYDRPSDVHQHQ